MLVQFRPKGPFPIAYQAPVGRSVQKSGEQGQRHADGTSVIQIDDELLMGDVSPLRSSLAFNHPRTQTKPSGILAHTLQRGGGCAVFRAVETLRLIASVQGPARISPLCFLVPHARGA